jgi:hypothetical protein
VHIPPVADPTGLMALIEEKYRARLELEIAG